LRRIAKKWSLYAVVDQSAAGLAGRMAPGTPKLEAARLAFQPKKLKKEQFMLNFLVNRGTTDYLPINSSHLESLSGFVQSSYAAPKP